MRSSSEVARICVRPYATLIHLALSPSVMRTGSVSYVSSVDYAKHEDIQVTDDDEGDQLQGRFVYTFQLSNFPFVFSLRVCIWFFALIIL